RIDMSKQLSEGLQELKRRRKILFFTVRTEAEQLRVAGESEEKIPRPLGLKHGCVPEFIRTILRLKGEMPEGVFINEAGRQLEHNIFRRRMFEPLLQKAGLRRVRFHDLRHTFASLLLQQGESPPVREGTNGASLDSGDRGHLRSSNPGSESAGRRSAR